MRAAPAILFLLALNLQAEEKWSRFRGPNGSGIAAATGYPIEFGPNKNLLWRTPLRPGKSSPVLTAKHIFLTGFTDKNLYTQCFDRATGKLLWERSETAGRIDGVNQLNHPAAITPVTDGDNVYVFFKDFGLLSYTPAGKLRWRVPVPPTSNSQGLGAAPILAGNLLILQIDQMSGSYISAYSLSNGELRWKIAREESESWGTPILYQRPGKPLQIITVGANQIGGHQVSDGKRTFTFPAASPAMVATPILQGDTLYAFGYGARTRTPFARILESADKNKDGVITPDEYGTNAMYPSIGRFMGNKDGIVDEKKWELWLDHVGTEGPTGLFSLNLASESPTVGWRFEKGFDNVIPSPLLHDGVLYSVRNGGILTAFDAKTGEVTKTARIPGALGGYTASPVLAAGNLYFANEEGKVSVIRPGRQWELLQLNDLKEEIFATPALSAGRIYLRTADALYCFAPKP